MPLKETYTKGKKGSHTAERVAREIRRAILHRELLPGEHVRQEFWAQRVGVSSAPTREGLKMLVAEQLVSYDAHRGYFVAKVNGDEMAQIYLIRRALESEVLKAIEWPSEEETAHMYALAEEVSTTFLQKELHESIDAVRRFAFTLFDLCPLELLVRETKRYWDRAAVYRALVFEAEAELKQQTLQAHYFEVVSCLRDHDRARLIELNNHQRSNVPFLIQRA